MEGLCETTGDFLVVVTRQRNKYKSRIFHCVCSVKLHALKTALKKIWFGLYTASCAFIVFVSGNFPENLNLLPKKEFATL